MYDYWLCVQQINYFFSLVSVIPKPDNLFDAWQMGPDNEGIPNISMYAAIYSQTSCQLYYALCMHVYVPMCFHI